MLGAEEVTLLLLRLLMMRRILVVLLQQVEPVVVADGREDRAVDGEGDGVGEQVWDLGPRRVVRPAAATPSGTSARGSTERL